ncbi:trypsin-like serine protease [Streptomyces sp. NPDC093109]|uniref:trypsin-like serine peptidase n=1 Tax=Streptomyces sp. NPDC093109 TaxID=3154977 RepID=UPI00344F8A16
MRNVRTPALLMGGALFLFLPFPAAHATPPRSHSPSPSTDSTDRYWTASRMRAAQPVRAGGTERAGDDGEGGEGAGSPSRPSEGLPIVGTFFWSDAKGSGHFCGGTVVNSPGKNLVMSAAHCFDGTSARPNLAFVPQYDDGKKPYGSFAVKPGGVFLDKRYLTKGRDAAATLDFNFVQLEPRDGKNVQDVVGGADLMTDAGYAHSPVRLVGYPANQSHPLDCTDRTERFDSPTPGIPGSFLRIECDAYSGGSSGGPFLVKRVSGWGIIGVIGGWKTGGDTDDVSYSPYFGRDVKALYDRATSGEDSVFNSGEVLATAGTWRHAEALAMEILRRE